MGAKTNYEEGIAIKAAFGDAHDANHPNTYYMGLIASVTDGETQTWVEVTGDGAARVAVANTDAEWDITNGGATDANADGVADNATVTNVNPIVWPAMTAQKTTIGVAWFDAAAGGNARFYQIGGSVTIPAGVQARYEPGQLTYQEDD